VNSATANRQAEAKFGQWMQTATGRQVYPLDPRVEDICIEDIAHALSNQCRFAGHVRHFYSVAQHSVLVSYCCKPEDALWGLLHDATEAYLVDVPTPVKRFLSEYKGYENALEKVICDRFLLQRGMPPSVHKADAVLLATEARDLMGPPPASWGPMQEPLRMVIIPWDPGLAKRKFLQRFVALGGDL
jgi:hypothetical protein